MNMEIERKFLVVGDRWRTSVGPGLRCEQGYLSTSADGATVRVRQMDGTGFLTIKGPTAGFSRIEIEYEIPEKDARDMLDRLCGSRTVRKTRYRIDLGGLVWEIDEFSGANDGLVLAEVELESETQTFEKPGWLGRDVSKDPRYFNAALANNPFSLWRF